MQSIKVRSAIREAPGSVTAGQLYHLVLGEINARCATDQQSFILPCLSTSSAYLAESFLVASSLARLTKSTDKPASLIGQDALSAHPTKTWLRTASHALAHLIGANNIFVLVFVYVLSSARCEALAKLRIHYRAQVPVPEECDTSHLEGSSVHDPLCRLNFSE